MATTRRSLSAFKPGARPEGEGAAPAPAPQAAAAPEPKADERKVATLRLPRPAWRQLKNLAMDLETSEQKLLALGMNMVFRSAGLPELAEDAFSEDELRQYQPDR